MHESERVARSHRSLPQSVVKTHFTILNALAKMVLTNLAHELVGQSAKLHVVGCDDTKGALPEKFRQHPTRSDLTFSRVGPVQDFVQQEEHWHFARLSELYDSSKLLYFRVEVAHSTGECIGHANDRAQPTEGKAKLRRQRWTACKRQNCAHPEVP